MKTEGAYSIWKKNVDGHSDGRRTARYRMSSADYVSSGALNSSILDNAHKSPMMIVQHREWSNIFMLKKNKRTEVYQ